MLPIYTLLILCAVSAVLLALGCFVPGLGKVCGVLCVFWLAAALPLLFFLELSARHALLFYLISGALGLIFLHGGKKA